MKPTLTSPDPPIDLLAFGAHPDDIEFGCGAIIAAETALAHRAHFVVCSHGESASNGTPRQRIAESEAAARILNASLEFLDLGGDAHFEIRIASTLALAAAIRQRRPRTVLAPTPHPNQHPDHAKLGEMVRDAVRLARYGGLNELKTLAPHAVNSFFFYAIAPNAELPPEQSILIDVSAPTVIASWTAAMEAHASQLQTRKYVDLQLTRATLHGHRAGVSHALPLYPNDPLLFSHITGLRTARHL